MEAGTRTEKYVLVASGAVDESIIPTQPFTLIEICVNSDGAITTSENLVLDTVRVTPSASSGYMTIEEHAIDLSKTGLTSVPIRLDKRFGGGTEINVTYTNTDNNAIEILFVYQLEDSVNDSD